MTARWPNLLVPGAGKSGTSSLHVMLDQHPDVYMSVRKEPHILSLPGRAARAAEMYADLFAEAGDQRILGESSTSYLASEAAAQFAKRELGPDLRAIVLLRNPVDRVLSHHRWLVGLGWEWRPLRQAVLADRAPSFEPARVYGGNWRQYLMFSLYGQHLRMWNEAIGADRVHVLTTEALNERPQEVLGACFKFLGLSPHVVEPRVENRSRAAKVARPVAALRSLNVDLRRRLDASAAPGLVKQAGVAGVRLGVSLPARLLGRLVPVSEGLTEYSSADRAWLAGLLEPDVQMLGEQLGAVPSEWTDFAF